MVELLLQRSAQVDAKCANGRTPLDVAVSIGAYAIAELLRAHGGKE